METQKKQSFSRLSFRNKQGNQPAELTIHYRKRAEKYTLAVSPEDIEDGSVMIFFASVGQYFTQQQGATSLYLSAENLARASAWYSANSTSGVTLDTQQV